MAGIVAANILKANSQVEEITNRLQSEKRIAVMEADAMVKKMNQDVTETANHKRTVYAM
eukprot:CAMPEP_0172482152 /NCGR_PEP_ID=MMETSP1066-20121228/8409_1 /TAXON_ID=671091 /ORGANISM="Coscinodiscus wailesii, Strain CCMP2513" /LENGTH=58 /DNA_ID=CAMNT_0013245059 /DNA_START=636 /DNA_END=809 /DNA_ORIENTATION=+